MRRTLRHFAPSRRPLRLGLVAAALALASARGWPAEPQDRYAVQAAMLVNVVKFVSWPGGPAPDRALRICAVASPRFAAALAALARGGAPISVVEVRSPARASGCEVAILGEPLDDELEDAAEQLGRAGVLTVSDHDGAARRGVQVNFVLEGGRVRFEVNLAAARRAGVAISSKLLRLARVIEAGP